MKRRDFLKVSPLYLLSFTPFLQLGAVEETGKDPSQIRDKFGIMHWTWDLIREVMHCDNGVIPSPYQVERALLAIGFPEDTHVTNVFQDFDNKSPGIINIVISQRDLPRVSPGGQIPEVTAEFGMVYNRVKFLGWYA